MNKKFVYQVGNNKKVVLHMFLSLYVVSLFVDSTLQTKPESLRDWQ